jgi:YggT family protein
VVTRIFCWALTIYWLILLAKILMSWIPPSSSGSLRTVQGLLDDLTEPVLRPVRGLLPPVRMGMMALDLSPILVFVVIAILRSTICSG